MTRMGDMENGIILPDRPCNQIRVENSKSVNILEVLCSKID